mmetsp:Transcript_2832/g.6013  ORF Transcript_2832/g.6013 Transcript_2832/m.6013 type:complete len:231 (-) Transcript_2832:1277-1969(-)
MFFFGAERAVFFFAPPLAKISRADDALDGLGALETVDEADGTEGASPMISSSRSSSSLSSSPPSSLLSSSLSSSLLLSSITLALFADGLFSSFSSIFLVSSSLEASDLSEIFTGLDAVRRGPPAIAAAVEASMAFSSTFISAAIFCPSVRKVSFSFSSTLQFLIRSNLLAWSLPNNPTRSFLRWMRLSSVSVWNLRAIASARRRSASDCAARAAAASLPSSSARARAASS